MAGKIDQAAKVPVARTVDALRAEVASWRQEGQRVALVPTMGALHEGHLALVRRALSICDRAVTSIFVNPTQFGPQEDFARYPRDEDRDLAMLKTAGCHLTFAPNVEEMYPAGFATTITAGPIADGLCGPFRPGHFAGVATVVTKLLLQTQPDVACFGEKDYQQLQVIRRVVRDLDIAVHIEGVPTVRDPDGLALSSRNHYLSLQHRRSAKRIYAVLLAVADRIRLHADDVSAAIAWAKAELMAAGFATIDYLSVCDADTLVPLHRLDRPARVLVAAWLGRTRLIDNVPVDL